MTAPLEHRLSDVGTGQERHDHQVKNHLVRILEATSLPDQAGCLSMEIHVKLDDPQKPEFASWYSYKDFARRVCRERRYVWAPEVQAFLDTVLATIRNRDLKISEGTIMFRAQRGIGDREDEGETGISAFGPSRMKPLMDRAREGRANPLGIPILYLASEEETAICEVRPWIGSNISVAQFKIARDIRVINLSSGHGYSPFNVMTLDELVGDETPSREKKNKAVWIDIDNAFSSPITLSDDTADYVPTQILTELFCENGYEGIIYRSHFGKVGHNIALFSVEDAKIINAAPYVVTEMKIEFEEIGNRWFSEREYESIPLDSE